MGTLKKHYQKGHLWFKRLISNVFTSLFKLVHHDTNDQIAHSLLCFLGFKSQFSHGNAHFLGCKFTIRARS